MPTLERARAKHNDIIAQLAKARDREERDADRWARTRAKRKALERSVGRSGKRLDKLRAVEPVNAGPVIRPGAAETPPSGGPLTTSSAPHSPDPLDPPEFLKRDPQQDKDAKARRELAEQEAAKEKAKRAGRAAKRNAIARGDTKRLPLQGKDALKFIAEGG